MNSRKTSIVRKALFGAIIIGLGASLAACGGGGGGNGAVTTTPPPLPPPPAPPTPPPAPPPPAPTPAAYSQLDNQIIPTGAQAAWKAGFTGAGVKVGVLDGGSVATNPTLDGSLNAQKRNKVAWFENFTTATAPTGPTSPVNTSDGHGDQMSQLIAGNPDDDSAAVTAGDPFAGGVAPGSSLYEAAVCNSTVAGCTNTAASYNALVGQGVRIFNESQGILAPNTQGLLPITQFNAADDASNGVGFDEEYLDPIVEKNGILLVVSTGDDIEVTSPSLPAGLPYVDPGQQPYTIAVTGAYIDSNGNPETTPPVGGDAGNAKGFGATPCGVTADWCVTAPWQFETHNTPPTFDAGGAVGTSGSAAVVSGVAALVSQAYPWMLAPQLSDTILSTATPLGTGPYPNAQFGWGFVNAAKAVDGPAQFLYPAVYGPFQANVGNYWSTFSNAISGAGGLTVSGNGQGRLILTGTDTYAGATAVNTGATLFVDGSIASPVTINGGGLAGVGTINGDVDNVAGTLTGQGIANITNNLGGTSDLTALAGKALTINGNLTEGSGATTAVALGDPLTVNGNAQIAGAAQVLAPASGYTVAATDPLLNAKALTGTFGSLTFASGVFYTGTLSYTSTAANVTVTQVAATSVAAGAPTASAQTMASAANLDRALATSNAAYMQHGAASNPGWYQAAGQFLSAPSAANAVASMNSLSGEIYADSRAVAFTQGLAVDQALANRQNAITPDSHGGVWAAAVGANGGLSRSGFDPMSYRSGGAIAGADLPLGDGFTVGVAGGHIHTWTDSAMLGGSVDAREDFAAVYGNWLNPNGWYVDGRLTDANIRNGVLRDVLLGESLHGIVGNHDDHLQTLTFEGGKHVPFGSGTLTPYVAITGMRLEQGAFAEQGNAMGLAAQHQTHTATLGTLGLRYTEPFEVGAHRAWLTGYAAYRRVFGGDDLGFDGEFVGLPGTSLRLMGQNLPRNVGIVGADWNIDLTTNWTGFIGVSYEAGNESAHQVEADAGLRFKF